MTAHALRRVLRTGVVLACALTVVACSPFGSRRNQIEPAELRPIQASLMVQTRWSVEVGRGSGVGFQPVVAGDAVFAAAADGSVIRVNPTDGSVQWRQSLGTGLAAGVGSDGQIVVVASEQGELIALDAASGAERWRSPTGSSVVAAPVASSGFVLIRTGDYRLQAFSATDGARRWSLQRPGPPLALRAHAEIVIDGPTAYAGLPGGRLLAIDLATGQPRFEFAAATPRGASELERVVDVVGAPILESGGVCAVTHQGRLGCYDARSGAPFWTRDFSSSSGLSADPRFVVSAADNGSVQAFQRNSGTPAWRNDDLSYRRLSAPVSVGRAFALGDYQGQVHFLSRDDGTIVARAATDGSAIISRPLLLLQGILVQTSGGRLVALSVGA